MVGFFSYLQTAIFDQRNRVCANRCDLMPTLKQLANFAGTGQKVSDYRLVTAIQLSSKIAATP